MAVRVVLTDCIKPRDKKGEKMKRIKSFLVTGILLGAPALALATPPTEFTIPQLPMTLIYGLGTAILAGLAVMWVFRKGVKTTNRS